ncbi:unnamed protein product [Caenorhabditis nigoni]
MSISGQQGVLTRAMNAVTAIVDETTANIVFWKKSLDDTIITQKNVEKPLVIQFAIGELPFLYGASTGKKNWVVTFTDASSDVTELASAL